MYYINKFRNSKKNIIIIGIAVIIFLLVCVGVFVFSLKEMHLLEFNQEININYNNYLYGQRVDFHNKNLYFTNQKFLFSNLKKIENEKMKIVRSFDSKFQIYNDKMYYLEEKNLIESTMQFNEKRVTSNEVSKFLVSQDGVFYTKISKNHYETLFFKNNKEDEKELCKKVEWFCIYKDGVIVLKENKMLLDEGYDVIEIDIKKYSEKKVAVLRRSNILCETYLANNYIVFITADDVVSILDLETKKQRVIFNELDGFYRMQSICDENFLYLSVQEVDQKGFYYSKTEDDKNGLYKINLSTEKSSKISKGTYDEMYLFGGYIFGYRYTFWGEKLYQISESGKVCKEIL